MHRRVDRYLVREILPLFLVAILAFLVFIGLELVISLSDTVLARGAGATELLHLVAYKLPTLFTYAIPAAALLATFLALGRLAADRELLAFQALGYSLRRLMVPFLLFGAVVSGISFALSEYAVPPAEEAYRRELLALLYRGASPQIQQAVFFRGLYGETYYVEQAAGDLLTGILVYDLTGRIYPVEGQFPTVITAREGQFQGGTLELAEGRVLRFTPSGGLAELVRFDQLTLEVEEDLRRAVLGGKTAAEMSLRELGERIELLRRSGVDPRSFLLEYHSKIAVSVAALVFVLFGAPLGALLGRGGRAGGAIAGFLLAAAAQGLFVWTRTLAQRGVIPTYLGAWTPHLTFGLLGLLLLAALDRLRLRGVLPFLLLVALGPTAQGTLPLTSFQAEELRVAQDSRVIEARGVEAEFGGYRLVAQTFLAQEEDGEWAIQATEACLVGADAELRANTLRAQLDASGSLKGVTARGFSGSSSFQGPEKEETILYSGEYGKASFAAGQLARVEATGVRFTTCPCLSAAPYTVEAAEFVLVPKEWLYARSITVTSWGIPVGWLPVYAARLGEEAFPLFPEVGWTGTELFLRWAIPWALGERVVGALGITLYLGRGSVDPSLRAVWEGGSLAVTPTSLRLRVEGGDNTSWAGTISLTPTAQQVDLTGRIPDWDWAVSWGEGKRREEQYERRPEVTLARTERGWLGGDLALRLSGGVFREREVEAWRLVLSLSWSGQFTLGPLSLSLPWDLSLAQYTAEERMTAAARPALSWGPVTVSYLGRVGAGRSPFRFDTDPAQSQVVLALSLRLEDWQEHLSWGWNVAAGEPLPLHWTVSGSGLSSEVSFTFPLSIAQARWSLTLRGGAGRLSLDTALRAGEWEDAIIRGAWSTEGVDLFAAVRVGPLPLHLGRLALSAEWRMDDNWSLSAAVEYDARSGRVVQLEGEAVRSLAGCLRVGVALGLRGIRLTLEVPAFPQAKVRFAPLDEGLRFGD